MSFCLVSGQDLQVPGCDRRDSMLSTPNRLYKDARQIDSNVLCEFICLWKRDHGGGAQHKVNKLVFLDVEFSEMKNKGEKKNPRRKRCLFTLPGYHRSRPASLFHQEKMLIINLGLLATSLFNG